MTEQNKSNDESRAVLAIEGAEFLYNDADLIAENEGDYGYNEGLIDYERVRFIGLKTVPGGELRFGLRFVL